MLDSDFVNAAVFRVGQPGKIEAVRSDLQGMQDFVGGYIQMVPIDGTVYTLVCNEEGLPKGLPFNRYVRISPLRWDPIVGDFFVVRIRNEEFLPVGSIDLKLLEEDYVALR